MRITYRPVAQGTWKSQGLSPQKKGGKGWRGNTGPKRLMTDEQILEFRALYHFGCWQYKDLAKRYGISLDSCRRYAGGITRGNIVATEADLPEWAKQ